MALSKYYYIGITIVVVLVGIASIGLFVFLNRNPEVTDYYDMFTLNTTSALCLDGSPAAYYLSKGGDPSKIYVYFMGGGWCGGVSE